MILLGRTKQRPQNFRLNVHSPLYSGLVFAGLGGRNCARTLRYADSSPYGNHGTLTNMDPPTDWVWSSELGRWVLDFDGSNDLVNLPNSNVIFPSGASAGTIVAMVWPSSLFLAGRIYSFVNMSGGSAFAITGGERSSRFSGFLRNFSNGLIQIDSTETYSGGYWYGIALTAETSNGNLYIDGKLAANSSIVNISTTLNSMGASPTRVAVAPNGTQYCWLGQIADTAAWSRALSLSEISALADPTNVLFRCGGVDLIQGVRTLWPGFVASGRAAIYARRRQRHRLGVT